MKISVADFRWVLRSLRLDLQFFSVSQWSLLAKARFVFDKYRLIWKHLFEDFVLGKSYVMVNGQPFFYGDKLGLSSYQSLLVRHQRMIQMAGISSPQILVDVGANVGCFSLMANDLFPEAKCYAFEPIKETFQALKKNVRQNKGITAIQSGIFSEEKTLSMKFDKQDSLVSEISETGNRKIAVTTLDAFSKKHSIDHIDILKVDVEGWETMVLAGAKHTLPKVKYLFIEITLENNENYTISSLFSHLYSKEFDFQLVAFRNYSDTSFGKMSIMDCLLVNKKYV